MSSSSMCWTMCMKNSCSASESSGEMRAASRTTSAPTAQSSRQTGASAARRGPAARRTVRQRHT